MPQGLISWKSRRSVVTLNAKPCDVTPRATWMPIAAILRSPAGGSVAFLPQNCSKGPPSAAPPHRRWHADAGQSANAACLDAKFAAEADKGFFHETDKVDGAEPSAFRVAQTAQIEDWVADQLARPVKRDIASAIDLVQSDAALRQQLIGGKNVGAFGIAPQREHRRMFEKQKRVADQVVGAQVDEFSLQAQRVSIIHSAEIEVLDHRLIRL